MPTDRSSLQLRPYVVGPSDPKEVMPRRGTLIRRYVPSKCREKASALRSEPQREGRRLAQLLRVKCREITRTAPIRCIIDVRPR
jgi:hypothetical protein